MDSLTIAEIRAGSAAYRPGELRREQSATDQANGGAAVENATLAKLNLTSDAFQGRSADPGAIYLRRRRPVAGAYWGEPPQGTKSFALVIDDPDAPSGTFRHWGVYDIPASARSIGGSQRAGSEVTNDFGKPGYGGPCPPKGHGPTITISSCSRSTSTRWTVGRTRKSPMSRMRRRSTRSLKAS